MLTILFNSNVSTSFVVIDEKMNNSTSSVYSFNSKLDNTKQNILKMKDITESKKEEYAKVLLYSCISNSCALLNNTIQPDNTYKINFEAIERLKDKYNEDSYRVVTVSKNSQLVDLIIKRSLNKKTELTCVKAIVKLDKNDIMIQDVDSFETFYSKPDITKNLLNN